MPPLLGAGLRFALAGAALVAVLAARRGWGAVRPTRPQLAGALLLGVLLPGANAVVTVAEVRVPSNVAALLLAAVPLVIVLLRRATGDGRRRLAREPRTSAYVNPVIAIAPGWLVLGEAITGLALAGAAVIVGSVALVVRAESVRR